MSSVVTDGVQEARPWEKSLGRFLEEIVSASPDKVFVEIGGGEYTYREFHEGVLKTASLFQTLGVAKGDRVGLFMPNCVEYLYCWFGLSAIGAISVPINTAYKRDETAYILSNAEAVALVTDPALADVAGVAADLAPSIRHRLLRGPDTATAGWTGFTEAFSAAPPLESLPEVAPRDLSMLVYTSGTTGNPKACR